MVLTAVTAPTVAVAKYASIIVDADTQEVLYSRNADTRNYPASLTKMMTLYLAFEALEDGMLSLNKPLNVSRRAAGQAPSRLGLKAGRTISVQDALMALIVKSANDIAVVVAEGLAKSESEFAQKMTAKARALGMKNTTFRNASGLPNRGQLSTARDISKLALALMTDFPQHYAKFSVSRFSYGGRTYRTHNNLLKRYSGTDGIKTGYTRASGFNIAVSAKRNRHRLVGVVFGGRKSKTRDNHMITLLEKGFTELRRRGALMARPQTKPDPLAPQLAAAPAPLVERARPKPHSRPDPIAVLIDNEPATDAATGPRPRRKPSLNMHNVESRSPANADVALANRAAPTALVTQGMGSIVAEEWGIQVGAFAAAARANAAAQSAAQSEPRLLAELDVRVDALVVRGKTLYRARLVGLSESDALRACSTLQKRSRDCAIVRPDGSLKLAALGD